VALDVVYCNTGGAQKSRVHTHRRAMQDELLPMKCILIEEERILHQIDALPSGKAPIALE